MLYISNFVLELFHSNLGRNFWIRLRVELFNNNTF